MLQKFPGFIDIHVHLREPGALQKEDFHSGSRAAIKGGFTFIVDMPNNPIPTFSLESLEKKISLSKEKSICDIGFHYGSNGKNLETFKEASSNPHVYGLKLYCNHTTGEYLIDDLHVVEKVISAWKSEKPILVHAEGEKIGEIVEIAKRYNQPLHICHISKKSEINVIREAKKNGQKVSAGVTPHHLFLTYKDIEMIGPYAVMKPELGTHLDQDALWEGLIDGTINLVETDHAPHTKEEKSKNPPPSGVPGLETAVGLLFKAVHDKRIKEKDILTFLYDAPKKIFRIPDQPNTYVELDPNELYRVGEDGYETKCGWSPFDGWEVYGRIHTVVVHGVAMIQDSKMRKDQI